MRANKDRDDNSQSTQITYKATNYHNPTNVAKMKHITTTYNNPNNNQYKTLNINS